MSKKRRLVARPSANDTEKYFEHEHKVEPNESSNLKTGEAVQANGHHIYGEESKMKDTKLTNKISCDTVQTRAINMKRYKKLATRRREKYIEKMHLTLQGVP